jgi:transcription initiation factor TFIIB
MPETKQATGCPECDGRLRSDGDETVCGSCGLVVSEDRIDRGPEWRGIDEKRERTGAPLTRSRHDRGLSTEIGRGSARLTGRKRRRLARMRRQHARSQIASKAERNQVHAFTEIARVTAGLSLPEQAKEHACMLFKRAQEEDLLRGRSIEGFAAASLYAACRIGSVSRTRTEIVEVASATLVELQAAYSAMNRELGLPTGPIDPGEYLPRYASDLDLPTPIETRAREHLADLREDRHVCGRDPSGVAAGCLYAAAKDRGHPLTQREAADAADVTPVTLRTTVNAIREREVE